MGLGLGGTDAHTDIATYRLKVGVRVLAKLKITKYKSVFSFLVFCLRRKNKSAFRFRVFQPVETGRYSLLDMGFGLWTRVFLGKKRYYYAFLAHFRPFSHVM